MNRLERTGSMAVEGAFPLQRAKMKSVTSLVFHGPKFDVVTSDDITMTFCVRLHDGNPWVSKRLDMMAQYYDPCPKIVIVDFGSEPEKAAEIEAICTRNGYTYKFVPDFGTFSLATARNIAFEQTTSDFIFFCDPDFVSERDLFTRLARHASALNMRSVVDIVLNPPAFHLDREDTHIFESFTDPQEQSSFLGSLSYKLNFAEASQEDERFAAPYSNVFLINRKMFTMVGGYDENFRGHGSEDFEFLLRLAVHSSHLPLPGEPQSDLYSPSKIEFYEARPYIGFRRLFELMSQPSEGLGLKVFHLIHYREKDADWYANSDWRRENFREATNRFISAHHQLLSIDYIPRQKKIACLCKNANTWGYFLPLRLAGYEIVPFFDDLPETLASITKALVDGEFTDVAIFNPYMKSHSSFLPIIMLARELERNVIVIERGALPSTIYYDDDVCYNSPRYSLEAFQREAFSESELVAAADYIADLRLGAKTLENMDSYEVTSGKFLALDNLIAKKCFIPLQLEDDMAVTMFFKGEQKYPEFIQSVQTIIEQNPDVIFLIKPHPLSKNDALRPAPNLIIADRMDNVHCLLDIADLTICYNSGVGLLSILHGTPTVTLGNAFYNLENAGYHAASASEGLARFLEGKVPPPDRGLTVRIAAWFTQRKYSQFIATDNIREFESRRSHGYKDILVTHFHWREHNHQLGRQKQTSPFSWKSYAAARIAPLNPAQARSPARKKDGPTLRRWGIKDFHESSYGKAAGHFVGAYDAGSGSPNLLRYAAEAYYRAGDRKGALNAQRAAIQALPAIRRAKIRFFVMKYPILRHLIGTFEMSVPKR